MTNFSINQLKLNDAKIITPFYSGDNRGSFEKIFEKDIFLDGGIVFNLNETFMSISSKNVIRGMHFQYNKPQKKLVTVLKGACKDIIVDLRKNSSTYLMHEIILLDDNNHNILYIPQGFAHGFVSLVDDMHMLYLCDGKFDKNSDTGILFDDKTLNINWPVESLKDCIHSDRDLKLMDFNEFKKMHIFEDL